MEHQLILLSADLRSVHARLSAKFKAAVEQNREQPPREMRAESEGDCGEPEYEPPEAA